MRPWRGSGQELTDPAFTRRYWGGVAFESDWQAGSTFTMELAKDGVKIADPAQLALEPDPFRRLSDLKTLLETGDTLPVG